MLSVYSGYIFGYSHLVYALGLSGFAIFQNMSLQVIIFAIAKQKYVILLLLKELKPRFVVN
ncbi:hypothetical protein NERG_01151 [Nematocida ausubeli]|uniref:Uncharacterized protein n=1 Tax=Nematocida ausubeli (strain ATCC PRA-371 / ERTm2) TaxID=1913371 RepID=H8ZD04_NEMA1|nr:hypothetical protein NERG_01151 [Nematocida ausubeli]